jgi:hypothetical protein
LRELADRYVAEAEAHGYSLDDLIEHLHARRNKVTQANTRK